jgi:hypothetical protein
MEPAKVLLMQQTWHNVAHVREKVLRFALCGSLISAVACDGGDVPEGERLGVRNEQTVNLSHDEADAGRATRAPAASSDAGRKLAGPSRGYVELREGDGIVRWTNWMGHVEVSERQFGAEDGVEPRFGVYADNGDSIGLSVGRLAARGAIDLVGRYEVDPSATGVVPAVFYTRGGRTLVSVYGKILIFSWDGRTATGYFDTVLADPERPNEPTTELQGVFNGELPVACSVLAADREGSIRADDGSTVRIAVPQTHPFCMPYVARSDTASPVDCSDLVESPAGPIARGCVHEVPDGQTLEELPDGTRVVRLGAFELQRLPPCPCAALAGAP